MAAVKFQVRVSIGKNRASHGRLRTALMFRMSTRSAGHWREIGDLVRNRTNGSRLGAPSETLIIQYDNLTFAINVPEPFTLSLFGAGRRRKRRDHVE